MDIQKLQQWYLKHHRKLPFRETHNPYHIWVSEIMLQQTQVSTVIPYFQRFIKTYPTVKSLALSTEDNLLHLIQGLGYYRRFKNMHKAAKKIMSDYDGIFPSNYQDVLSLPGIGEYTAGAIMSIAYNQPISATDGNVIRVLSRVMNIDLDMRIEKNKKQIKAINQKNIEVAEPKIYTQAIMELGALICKPANPLCLQCPMQNDCIAYHKGIQTELPYLSKRAKKKRIDYKTFIIYHEDHIYIRKRKEKLLGGMYEFPQFENQPPFQFKTIKNHGVIKHIFTHLVWHMDVSSVRLKANPLEDWIMIKPAELNQYPMSTAHRKLIQFINEN